MSENAIAKFLRARVRMYWCAWLSARSVYCERTRAIGGERERWEQIPNQISGQSFRVYVFVSASRGIGGISLLVDVLTVCIPQLGIAATAGWWLELAYGAIGAAGPWERIPSSPPHALSSVDSVAGKLISDASGRRRTSACDVETLIIAANTLCINIRWI